MSHPANLEARRRFLKAAVVGAIAAPAAGILLPKLARAQDLPHLEESDATATALGYKHDAAQVDKAKYPQYQAGHNCANCNFFQGKTGAAWGPCQLFPGKAVAAKGWCAGYAAKA